MTTQPSPYYRERFEFGENDRSQFMTRRFDRTESGRMSINGKRDDVELNDFKVCVRYALMKRSRTEEIIGQVQEGGSKWKGYAEDAGISGKLSEKICNSQPMNFLK